MLMSNRAASEAIRDYGVRAATDITGFGLLGHAWEVAKASGVTIEIDAGSVPLLPGAIEMARLGMLTQGDRTNREYVGNDVLIDASTLAEEDGALVSLFYDPQTAGGLLISIGAEAAPRLLETLRSDYTQAAVIGKVLQKGQHLLAVGQAALT
jgi:selenide,water dikinase